ncbi:hypothetical protein GCM10011390_49550 [Aureimonas endophytica]|uniref:PhnA-like protein n=1 Tax=Aureimonas endophytica TaxID=2027858 RepID=A0A917A3N0_9HYPH|nr:hypothetical protein [Aureimonas endophytica]GGE24214.1 hypothetical protein GCM10011390_49550 [Aureimonas endophytica]
MSAAVHHDIAVPAVPLGSPRRVSWGAIFAGALLTLVVQVMLGLLGLGVGLSTVDPAGNGTPTLSAFGTGTGLWTAATVLVATFIGGYVAARLAGSLTRTDGALHGIVTWAASTLIVLYLLTSGAASIVSGTLGTIGSSFGAVRNAVEAVAPNSLAALPDGLEQQARQLLARGENQAQQAANQAQQQGQQAADQARAATGEPDLARAIPEIVRGLGENATPQQRQAAVTVISQQAGISQQEAEQRLQQFQQQYDQAMVQVREKADAAAKNVSTAAFAGFVALLIGAIVAGLGGMAGRPRRVVGTLA